MKSMLCHWFWVSLAKFVGLFFEPLNWLIEALELYVTKKLGALRERLRKRAENCLPT